VSAEPATGVATRPAPSAPAAALDRLPRRLVLLGVEAADVGVGPCLSPPVAAAVPAVVQAVMTELGPTCGTFDPVVARTRRAF